VSQIGLFRHWTGTECIGFGLPLPRIETVRRVAAMGATGWPRRGAILLPLRERSLTV